MKTPTTTPVIPYGHQDIRAEDIAAVQKILESDFLTQGTAVPAFENALCRLTGAKHGIAVNSATSALHLACRSLGLGKGDCVWTSPNTFVASANCALYCGADIDFIDIDAETLNISCDKLEEKLAAAKREGHLPKVLIPVHFAGRPTEQERIWQLAQKYQFHIIEDASHAIGALNNKEPVGSCRWSDITIFSFHPVKIITTGEGGAALTNNPQLAEKMAHLRSHGIIRNEKLQQDNGAWYYQQIDLGYNYRITDIQAALGISQLARLEEYIARRNALAKRYNKKLAELPLHLPSFTENSRSAWHLYIIQLKEANRRREVFEYLRAMGIGVNVHYIPVYLQPWYQRMGFPEHYCPNAEKYYNAAITLPLFPTMTEKEQDRIITCLGEIV